MKKYLIILLIGLISCSNNDNLSLINTEIITGKVSAIREGVVGRICTLPTIWIQSSKETRSINIPFEYENRWKVGDTCTLVIQKYKQLIIK